MKHLVWKRCWEGDGGLQELLDIGQHSVFFPPDEENVLRGHWRQIWGRHLENIKLWHLLKCVSTVWLCFILLCVLKGEIVLVRSSRRVRGREKWAYKRAHRVPELIQPLLVELEDSSGADKQNLQLLSRRCERIQQSFEFEASTPVKRL